MLGTVSSVMHNNQARLLESHALLSIASVKCEHNINIIIQAMQLDKMLKFAGTMRYVNTER